MAFEELLELLSKREALDAKLHDAMSLFMLATAHTLSSEELTPGDAEWKAIAARAEERTSEMIGEAARSAETSTRQAAEMAARPGGEAVAEAHRRMAVSALAMGARAQEFAAYMREVAAMKLLDSDSDSESDSAKRPAARRSRRPNGRYFGPEWRNRWIQPKCTVRI